MALQFGNPILGGVTLIRPAIRSPNYVAGSAGWTVNQDGSVEFNNATIRGGLVVSGIRLVYSGVPALGNLIESDWPAGGTDAAGNAVLPGPAVYAGGGTQAMTLAAGGPGWWTAPGPAGPWTVVNAGVSPVAGGGVALTGTLLELSPPVNGPITAADPSTGNTLETWHTLTISATGLSAGTPAPKYRLYPDNTVAVSGLVNAVSGTVSGAFATLPAGYRPLNTKKWAVPISAGTPATTANAQITLGSTGVIQLSAGPTGAAYNFSLDMMRFPLDY